MQGLGWKAMILAVGLVGCGERDTTADTAGADTAAPAATATAPAADGQRAMATLTTAEGAPTGTAMAVAGGQGLQVSLTVEGLPPGTHGAHVHTTGRCDAPAFESAGGHWNPMNTQHGLENPQGAHAGDMPNLEVGPDGRGMLSFTLPGGTLDGLMDADGSAMMVHATADDQRTDPSGNSGGRIACGVFTASQ